MLNIGYSMNNENTLETKKTGFFQLLKRTWPSFLTWNSFAFTVSTIFINFLIVSNIIWPGESFHSSEMGILVGTTTYIMAFSGILFGMLADKYSRKILMSITEIIFGLGYLLNGFVTQGLGLETYTIFLIFSLLRGFASGGFWPILNSYGNDSTEEGEKSQFFGILQALF